MSWRGRLWHWMKSKPAPVLWPEGAETCPRCGRPIAGAIAPHVNPRMMPMRWPKTKSELIALCPIDGSLRRAHIPHAVSVESLRQEATSLAANLRQAHDPGWAKYFEA